MEERPAGNREPVTLRSTLELVVVVMVELTRDASLEVVPIACLDLTSCPGASVGRRKVRSKPDADGWVILVRGARPADVAVAELLRPVMMDEAVVDARCPAGTAVEEEVRTRLAGAARRLVLETDSLIPIEANT